MHTDSIITLLRTLRNFPDLDQIKIEGRILTPEQRDLLGKHPVFKFYMSGRIVRAAGGQDDIFLFSRDINLDSGEVASLLQTPFTPSVLSDTISYKTGYFSAESLVSYWLSTGQPNDLLPIVGGTNEFHIGSDTLSDERLSQIAEEIIRQFGAQELAIRPTLLSQRMINTSNNYLIPSLNLSPNATRLLDVRPAATFPGQVRDMSEIVVGETYIEMHRGQKSGTFKVTKAPYKDLEGNWWVDVEKIYPGGAINEDKVSLADRGIVPYSNNKWNPANCLIKEAPGAKTGN